MQKWRLVVNICPSTKREIIEVEKKIGPIWVPELRPNEDQLMRLRRTFNPRQLVRSLCRCDSLF